MNQRTRLKRQNAARIPRQAAALIFQTDLKAMLGLLPQMQDGLVAFGAAVEVATASIYKLSAAMSTLRNDPQ